MSGTVFQVFVGGIPYAASGAEVRELCRRMGVPPVRLAMPGDTDKPGVWHNRGFAFLTYQSAADQRAAVAALDGLDWHGRRLKATEARPRGEGREATR